MLLDEDSFEMLEDLEFYAWLDLEAPAADADDNVGRRTPWSRLGRPSRQGRRAWSSMFR